MERLIGVLQDASRELVDALSQANLVKLQAAVAPVAAISDEFWYHRYFPAQSVYVVQVVCVETRLKGSGAFRALMDPVIAQCEAEGLPMVLQTHNPDNVPIYEHFGFSLLERVDAGDGKLSCYNLARRAACGASACHHGPA